MRRDPLFSLAVRRSDAGTVVSVTGELDLATAPELQTALAGADGDGDLTVDLNATTFVDPAGLRVLLAACEERSDVRVLRRDEGAVARLLALTGTESRLGV